MLDIRAAIDHLIVRIKAEAQRHQSTSETSPCLFLESKPMVSGIEFHIEISMNWRTRMYKNWEIRAKAPLRVTMEMAANHHTHFEGRFVFDVDSHASDMARVLRVCDFAAKSLYQEQDHFMQKRNARNNSLRQWVFSRLIRIQEISWT